MNSLSKLVFLYGVPEFLEISSSSYCSFGVKQQSLTSLLIYQTLFLVVFENLYDVYLFEIKHVCKEPSLIILRYADYFVLVTYKFNVIE